MAARQAGAFKAPVITTFHGYDANLIPRQYGSDYYEYLFRHGDLFTVGSEFDATSHPLASGLRPRTLSTFRWVWTPPFLQAISAAARKIER